LQRKSFSNCTNINRDRENFVESRQRL
jgi:hypothetical protein